MKRLLVSLFMALVLFAAFDAFFLVAPAPQRAFYNMWANPGGILFMATALFAVFGTPMWLAIFAFLTFIGAFGFSEDDQNGGKRT